MFSLSFLGERVLRLRWVLMFLLGGSIFWYELVHHGLKAFKELEFYTLFEFFIMGIITPLMGGYLLSQVSRFRSKSARYRERLDQYKSLLQELERHRELGEMMRFLVQYPRTFLPVIQSWLYVYDHCLARLELVAAWNILDSVPAIRFDSSSGFCHACLSFDKTPIHFSADQCPLMTYSDGNQPANGFCLSLSYNKLLIGTLRLSIQPEKTLTREQMEFMKVIAPKLAFALAIAIAVPRQMAKLRLHTQIMERQQTAIDLHNDLAQQVGVLHLGLDRIVSNDRLQMSRHVRDELEYLRQVAADAYQQIRNTLAMMLSWESVDLTHVIVDYTNKVSQRAHLSNRFTTVGDPINLPTEMCRQVLSLFQESLNNVEKYAQAQHLNISLFWLTDCLIMVIADDGIGFDPSSLKTDGHYGLMMMRELVNTMKGHFEIDSSPGQGTRLNFKFPLLPVQLDSTGDQTLPINSCSPIEQHLINDHG